MVAPYADHRRPLYLEAQVNGVFIRRALVDTGSSVNIVPLSVLKAAGIPTSRIVKSAVTISGFDNGSEDTMGYIQLDLKPIRIPGNQAPFNHEEAHYSEARYYDNFTQGNHPSKIVGTPLPSWIEVRDLDDDEFRMILTRRRHGGAENNAYGHYISPRCSKVTLPDGRVAYHL
ncbi:hypothetical protein M0R45_009292 [Rubus argutus]|uniref:Peptidase A2 domain-containing protein n=1 Tax=Rubus argutus TaxID=59490 RepID=A0AAW1Y5M4_RUBAR